MNEPRQNKRLVELLIDRATVGLTTEEELELKRLLANESIDDDFSFDYIAQLLFDSEQPKRSTDDEPQMKSLPQHIRSQIVDNAQHHVSANQNSKSTALAHSISYRREWVAWFVAAACILIAAFAWFNKPGSYKVETALIAKASVDDLNSFVGSANKDELIEIDLNNGNDPLGSNASGTVYWNRKTKRGFVKFDGLSVNDADEEQYQLWVIDKVRGIEDRPNAGVFDIKSEGTNVFSFRSDLKVFEAQGFAVTVEPPGGKNKSDLSRIALLNLDGS